jgi:DNA-binding NarL/FixJ family response regulator
VHRRFSVVAVVTAIGFAVLPIYILIHPQDNDPVWVSVLFIVIITGAIVAWGMFVRARRQLVLSLRERADRAEAEQQLRVEQAQAHERARIAREMHDVLAHRISLLSMHAGALEFRPDAPPEEIARAAGVVRATAHQALDDLREVIGVLREEPLDGDPERPQPTLANLPALLDESRQAGMHVSSECLVEDLATVPDGVGRNAYRIVQEALTNARKHAHGAAVDVTLAGAAGSGLILEVRNRLPVGAAPAPHPGGRHRADRAVGAHEPGRRPARARPHAGRRLRAAGLAAVAGMTGSPIRVLIADDDALVRSALSMMLAGTDDIRVVAEVADGAEVAAAVDAYRPDLVLMDIRMPRMDGLAATEQVRAREDAPAVIVLTTFDADDMVLRALRAGAGGFLLKDTPPPEILKAVRLVAAGEAMLSPTVTRRLLTHFAGGGADARRAEAAALLERLTDREREVALAVAEGKSNAEIAAALFMSVATVKAHVSRLLVKLELNNRVQIALLAHDAGLA